MVQIFSVPAFFILFRETLEASIVLSVMLTLINKIVQDDESRKMMKRKVWMGVVGGVAISLAAAAIFLSLYYTVAKQAWEKSEPLWEGVLGLIAVVLITMMAFSMIRVETWREKWERKLTKVTLEAVRREELNATAETGQLGRGRANWALLLIPFTVVVREGVEAVIFLGGIGLAGSGTAYPLPAVIGGACGVAVGYVLYKGGKRMALKVFLIAATLLLLVIAAGLFAGSVHELEEYTDNEHFLWKLRCCNPGGNNVWSLLQAVVGWRNEATQGTLSAYISFWVFVLLALLCLRYKWNRESALLQAQTSPSSSV
ncbi:hypothetical protein KP509_16G029200 [Ceratopteris richardii]|uniref:Iron permease FTR1 n=1 Tax=Ceratopteris richardii TaxID=49495 RepID=A0A8T2T378_CERRI|nr:hypothetical protein KP509_16G029200 [Ceratopteris richardii]